MAPKRNHGGGHGREPKLPVGGRETRACRAASDKSQLKEPSTKGKEHIAKEAILKEANKQKGKGKEVTP